jgi:hypothetical protein
VRKPWVLRRSEKIKLPFAKDLLRYINDCSVQEKSEKNNNIARGLKLVKWVIFFN